MSVVTNDYRSIQALVERVNIGADSPTFTIHALRNYVRYGNQNGLEAHIRRIGRKILISESGFYTWLDSQRKAS